MSNWIMLHSTYNGTEMWIDMTQVRSMYRSQSQSSPVYATLLVYGKDDFIEVQESPEEILCLAKGIKPQASAFSLEELNAAQDAVEAATSKAVPGNSAWQQMWATPYEPQPEKETT